MSELDGEADRIESPPRRRRPHPAVTMMTIVVVAVTALVVHSIDGRHPGGVPAATVTPASLQPPARPNSSASRVAYRGSVFLEPLPQCLQTDHRRRLRLALAVTNLTNTRLRLVAATPGTTLPELHVTQVRFWTRPCGAAVTDHSPELPPSGQLVVAFTFDVGAACPYGGVISARLTFTADGEKLRAESSALTDLTRVGFAQCTAS